jgi:uncharacterized protein YfaS (alpha-2-macroglobulin family)
MILKILNDLWQKRHARFFIALGVIIAALAGIGGCRLVHARKAQPIQITSTADAPDTTGDPDYRRPLTIRFRGSAAQAGMADKEVSAGISISPPIEGTWRWDGDDTLIFKTEQAWRIGKQYTVTFAKNFFPSHIKTAGTISFSITDFNLNLGEGEFYIDPEDSAVKRVLATVSTNYPLDTALLEKSIIIEPRINAESGSLKKRQDQFSVNYNDDRTRAYIVSEALGMPAKPVVMGIRIQKGVKDSSGGGTPAGAKSVSVAIPGMTSYVSVRELSHELIKNEEQQYDQVLILETQGTIDITELSANLSAWELPVDRPELPGLKAQKNYNWSTDDMTPEVLKLARKIDLAPIPNELKYNSVNSFTINAEPERYVYIKLQNGARFYGGYVLGESYQAILRVKQFPKELAILSEGSILSFSGDKQLAMMSRGISSVEYNIGRIRPDDINHLVSQTYGDVTNINFNNYSFNQYNITEQYSASAPVPVADERGIGYFSFDFSRYLDHIPALNMRHGFFIFTVKGESNTSNSGYQDRRLIMVSDLGFFVKTGADGSRDIFVQSIATGDPVAGAAVSVLGLNGNAIVTTQSDSTGRARIPNLSEYRNEHAPTVYTVRLGEDMSFMPYSASGRSLDYSSFDVGGIQGASDPKTLRAFMFSDRGLYRPGDEARIGIVIKSGDWSANLARTPLECKVSDPRGAEIFNRRISLSPQGVEEIRFRTQDWSPTGTYTASVYVIREYRRGDELREEQVFLGSQTVKVEEFLPDTLNVSAVFDPLPKEGWIPPSELKALVTVRNLFGTPAAGNDVKAQINLAPGHQYFRQYRDYQFRDPYLAKNSFQEFLGTQTTGGDGTTAFNLNLAKFEKATYRLSFYSEAFEKGSGRNVSAEASVFVSPLPYLIGYKADGNLSYVQRDAARMISLIAIDPNARRTTVNDLTLTLTEMRYISALVRQPNGVYKYQSVRKEYPVLTEKITIPAAGLEYRLPSNEPGEYKLSITGPAVAGTAAQAGAEQDELVYNSLNFTIAGTTNIQRSLNRTAELEITLNKGDFNTGENIELMIKAPYAGAGLITIERDKVYAHKWFQSSGETTMQTITVPAGLEGNGYVNIQYLRSQDSPEIFMPPLCYGAAPFSISRENRTNRISLDIPAEAKPGEDFVIKYSTRQQGKIIVYAVDEGILQLAGYQTPDPLAFFFRKRALEVRTAQILDLVLPKYSVVRSLAAMGGGGGYDELSRNLNPFKRRQYEPVAYWSGIVDAGPEQRTLRYRVPDYFNGTLRVMAVSISDDAVGAGEDRSLVRSAFVIAPNAPLMAAPGDEFEISVTVTNLQKGAGEAGKVRLTAKPSPHLAISGKTEFDLSIPEGKDQTLNIPVKAAGPLGGAEIRFTASNGGEASSLAAFMSVRPAVPYRVSLYSGALKNKSAEVTVDRRLYEEFATRDVSLSYLPLGMAKGLSFYLEAFPYGCSEQITSAVFPFLYPQLFNELGFTKEKADEGVYRVIGIIQARMKEDGNVGMWTSVSYSDPLITVYIAHFLTEARNAGYYVAPAVMSKILQACRSIADSGGTSLYDISNRAYAIYILTLNEVITTPYIEKLKKDMGKTAGADTGLPGLYLAGSYALLQKAPDATALLTKIKRAAAKDSSLRYIDALTYHAVYLNILSRHFPQWLRDISESLLSDMSAQLEQRGYTTMSANYALMAVDGFLKAAPGAETGTFTVQEILKEKQKRELKAAGEKLFSAAFSAEAEKIGIENKDPLNLFYQVTAAGFDRELPKIETKQGIEVYREFTDEAGKPITQAKVGDVVIVKLNFRSLSSAGINDVAIVDLTPAGLETDIDSIRQASRNSRGAWTPDYVDIREDRIVVYGTVSPKLAAFTYRARAVNAGTFTAPPLFAQAMYDNTVWAMRPQEPLKIEKAK